VRRVRRDRKRLAGLSRLLRPMRRNRLVRKRAVGTEAGVACRKFAAAVLQRVVVKVLVADGCRGRLRAPILLRTFVRRGVGYCCRPLRRIALALQLVGGGIERVQ